MLNRARRIVRITSSCCVTLVILITSAPQQLLRCKYFQSIWGRWYFEYTSVQWHSDWKHSSTPWFQRLKVYHLPYCDSRNWRYSRYADDIYISSQEYIPASIRDELEKKLGEYGFVVNDKKTWFCSKKGRRQITGLILTESGRVSIGSEKREAIKKMVYNRIVHGQGDPNVILGHLAFLKDVEPKVYNSFLIKYAGYCDGDVIDAIMHGPKPKTIVFEVPEIFE